MGGDNLEIVGLKDTTKTTCTGVEMFKKSLPDGQAGDNVGALLRGVKRDEGGRHTPFFNNYRPQFFFRTADVTGNCLLPKDVEMVVPGDNASIDVELINPVAMAEGLRFAIREGGKTVGAGVVSKVIE